MPEELEEFRGLVREICEEKLAPRAAEIDEEDEFPWDVHKLFVENELMAVGYPLSSLSLLVTVLVLLIAAVALAGPVLFVFFAAIAMLQTVMLRQVLLQRGEITTVAQ